MSTSNKICNDNASKLNDVGVCEVNDMLQNMSTIHDKGDIVSVCANCGKDSSSGEINNICNKCKMAKYCNAACKKKHRHKHKKQCEEYLKLAAERAAELHDEKLFKQPPPLEDCPICFLRLPYIVSSRRYKTCCGKVICCGCIRAPLYDNQGNKVDNQKCPFCRSPHPKSDEEVMERVEKRVDAGDAQAVYNLGCNYWGGMHGLTQDYTKAFELWYRAGELGHAAAYSSIGSAYYYGRGVETDKKKAIHYLELAAMGGDAGARFNLGNDEARAGNMERALKHFMIAVEGGHDESLPYIKQMYLFGGATKEDYSKALTLHQEYLGEIRSRQRDEAAAVNEGYRYY